MSYNNDQTVEFLPWAQRFARSCANRLPSHLDRDDLQSAGVLGYLEAAERFHPGKGASFRGYCALRIRGAVLDELRRWDWAPRSVHRNQKKISQAIAALTSKLEREPTRHELAAALDLHPADLEAYQSQAVSRQVVSFDESPESRGGEETGSLAERIADTQALSPDADLLRGEERQRLLECIGLLTETQAQVIVLHYLKGMALRDVAAKLKVTPSRVSQVHHKALERLRGAWTRAEQA